MHPEPFGAVARAAGHGVLVCLRGELDLAGASKLSRALNGVESFIGVRVVLDLSELIFIDATGIGAIGRARDRLRRQGSEVIVRHPQPAVRRALETCGLDDWLEAPATRLEDVEPTEHRRAIAQSRGGGRPTSAAGKSDWRL